MKNSIYCLLMLCATYFAAFQVSKAQNTDVHDAKKEFRNKNYYWAAFYAASALHATELNDAQFKSMQNILRDSYEPGVKLIEDFIARDQELYKNFQGDTTVVGRKRIIGDLGNLVKLNDTVTSIPQERLASQTKKEPNLSFEKIDYSARIQAAKASYEESLQRAAQMHYEAAIGLESHASMTELVKAYDEYARCRTFVKDYLDAASRQQQTGDRIGELDYSTGEQKFAQGTMTNMESALKSFEHGLKYSKLPKLQEGKGKTILALSEMYYAKANNFLKGKEVTVYQTQTQTQTQSGSDSESMGLKVGIAPNTVAGKVINTLLDGNSSPEPTQEKSTVTTTTTTRHEAASLDNNFEAMIWLRRLEKINPGYKDADQLMRQAEAGTQFIDIRNNQTYTTFMVGKVVWMRENLDWAVSNSDYYYYTDKTGNRTTDYASGRYYAGLAVSQYKNNLCPSGWRLPTKQDVQELIANYKVPENVYGNLQFSKLGYGLRYAETSYVGRSFTQEGYGNSGEWWLAEPGATLSFSSEFKLSTSPLDVFHHCRCVKDQRPTE